MQNALIVTGGLMPPEQYSRDVLSHFDLVVTADSGYDRAKELGLSVHRAVGDFDSLSGGTKTLVKDGVEFSQMSRDKDYSDTELALLYCRDVGVQHCMLLGGGGGRMDHLLSNFFLMEKPFAPDIWLSSDSEIFGLASGPSELILGRGRLLSIAPLGPGPHKIISQGLQWELDALDWRAIGLSLSNVCQSEKLQIDVKSGAFLCILPYAEGYPLHAKLLKHSWRAHGQ